MSRVPVPSAAPRAAAWASVSGSRSRRAPRILPGTRPRRHAAAAPLHAPLMVCGYAVHPMPEELDPGRTLPAGFRWSAAPRPATQPFLSIVRGAATQRWVALGAEPLVVG